MQSSGFSPPASNDSSLNIYRSSVSAEPSLVMATGSALVPAAPATPARPRARARADRPYLQQTRIVRRESDSSEEEEGAMPLGDRGRSPRGRRAERARASLVPQVFEAHRHEHVAVHMEIDASTNVQHHAETHVHQNLQQNLLQQAVIVQNPDPEVVVNVVAQAAQAVHRAESTAQAEIHRVQLNAAAYAAHVDAQGQGAMNEARAELDRVRAEQAQQQQQASEQQQQFAAQQHAFQQQQAAQNMEATVVR